MAKKYLSIEEIESMGINGPKAQEIPAVKEMPGTGEKAKEEKPKIGADTTAPVAQKRRGRPRKDAAVLPDGAEAGGIYRLYSNQATKRMLADMKMLFYFREGKEMTMVDVIEAAVRGLYEATFPDEYRRFAAGRK